MRVPPVTAQPMLGAPHGAPTPVVRPAVTPEEAERALHLPVSVADRIARIMAADPGLAAAVAAQLPAARQESARQLAGWGQPAPAHLVDTVG